MSYAETDATTTTMRHIMMFALGLSCSAGCAGPQKPVTPPTEAASTSVGVEADTEPASDKPLLAGPEVMRGKAVGQWIQAVVDAQAKRGALIRVRVPVVIRSLGWGCQCPDYFIGDSPDMHPGGDTWLTLDQSGLDTPIATFASESLAATETANPCEEVPDGNDDDNDDDISPLEEYGAVVMVEGSFTGDRAEVDLRDSSGEPAEWLYQTWTLRITRLIGFSDEVAGEDNDLRVYSELEWEQADDA